MVLLNAWFEACFSGPNKPLLAQCDPNGLLVSLQKYCTAWGIVQLLVVLWPKSVWHGEKQETTKQLGKASEQSRPLPFLKVSMSFCSIYPGGVWRRWRWYSVRGGLVPEPQCHRFGLLIHRTVPSREPLIWTWERELPPPISTISPNIHFDWNYKNDIRYLILIWTWDRET